MKLKLYMFETCSYCRKVINEIELIKHRIFKIFLKCVKKYYTNNEKYDKMYKTNYVKCAIDFCGK